MMMMIMRSMCVELEIVSEAGKVYNVFAGSRLHKIHCVTVAHSCQFMISKNETNVKRLYGHIWTASSTNVLAGQDWARTLVDVD